MYFPSISLCCVVLQIWSKNIKMKSINLTALKKHGKVYEDGEFCYGHFFWSFGNVTTMAHLCYHHNTLCFQSSEQFGCLVWSHSETHLLYVAEKKRPKAESFFQVCFFTSLRRWHVSAIHGSAIQCHLISLWQTSFPPHVWNVLSY